jgi:hypothetical protein
MGGYLEQSDYEALRSDGVVGDVATVYSSARMVPRPSKRRKRVLLWHHR